MLIKTRTFSLSLSKTKLIKTGSNKAQNATSSRGYFVICKCFQNKNVSLQNHSPSVAPVRCMRRFCFCLRVRVCVCACTWVCISVSEWVNVCVCVWNIWGRFSYVHAYENIYMHFFIFLFFSNFAKAYLLQRTITIRQSTSVFATCPRKRMRRDEKFRPISLDL